MRKYWANSRLVVSGQLPPGSRIMLQTQSSRELDLWQTGYENAEKSSKIVPLAAPSNL